MNEPVPVEFQLLQLVVSYVGDERVTLGLLHWDGHQLRFHFDRKRAPSWLSIDRKDLERTMDAIELAIHRWSEQARPLQRLSEVVPVRQGEGSLLVWGPIQTGSTRFPEAQYQQLLELVHLASPPTSKTLAS